MESSEAAEIDSIVNSVENSSNSEIPMTSEPMEAAPPAPPQIQEYEFQTGGRTVKAPIEKILGWASQGYNAGNRIGQLSKQLEDFQAKSKSWDEKEKTYGPVDKWAKENPEKWGALLTSWQQAQFGQMPQAQGDQARAAIPQELIQKINQFDQRFQQIDQTEKVQREQRADQSLDGEIQSMRMQFSHFDFDAPDEKGNSLEYQILEHATKNGIPSFRAAARDYLFDKQNSFSENKGREAAAQSISPKTRSNLLGKNSQERSRGAPDLRGRNHDQVHEYITDNLSAVLANL